ncbi:hypothetical protein CFC21_061475 [Triticum aestivum]|uniref:RRM domain-containing protein n=3 Tax=Triticinae TaxID=1648030 RepID=A0A453HWI8_AEGTS|nr:hypothetical protein CFC21_061475 [Triticum aestivum]
MYDKNSGRSRGFGFVQFSNNSEAKCAKDAMDGKHRRKGQGGEPVVREEAEAVRHRWRPAAQEGPPPVRQVSQGHVHPVPAPHPQAAPQGHCCEGRQGKEWGIWHKAGDRVYALSSMERPKFSLTESTRMVSA